MTLRSLIRSVIFPVEDSLFSFLTVRDQLLEQIVLKLALCDSQGIL